MREMESRPETINAPNYNSTEWHQSRVYKIDGEEFVGTKSAMVKFEEQAETLAYKELGLDPGAIARNKEVTIVLGPPAAGKSTIANEIAIANRSAILDSDEIKKHYQSLKVVRELVPYMKKVQVYLKCCKT